MVAEANAARKLRHASRAAIEFLDDLEASGIVDEWGIDDEPRVAGFYMTLGMLRDAVEE
jgi:hypothetical protein